MRRSERRMVSHCEPVLKPYRDDSLALIMPSFSRLYNVYVSSYPYVWMISRLRLSKCFCLMPPFVSDWRQSSRSTCGSVSTLAILVRVRVKVRVKVRIRVQG